MTLLNETVGRFLDFLDWFIPDELRESEEEHRRLRAFVISHIAGPPLGAVIAVSLILQFPSLAAWTLLIADLLFFMFPFLLRWTKAKREVGLGSLLHFQALIFFVSYHYGGIQSPALSWTLTVPIVAMFFVDGFYRVIGLVTFALGFVLLGGLYLADHQFPNSFGTDDTGTITLILFISAAGYVTTMALTYIGLYEFSIARISHAKEEAEAANRAKTNFLANMSHELRTPLNAIIGFAQMISIQAQGPIENPAYVGYGKDIEESGAHLLHIINDILDISKIESEKFELELEEIDYAELSEEAAIMFREDLNDKEMHFSNQLPEKELVVRGDRQLLRQVLINLISNAVKYTPKNGEILLNVRRPDNASVEITVIDNGIGIAEQDIGRVMDPFEQVESSMVRTNGGIGLGLSLTKKIVEAHGGKLTLTSTVGVGTRATVWLPNKGVRKGASKAAPAKQKPAQTEDAAATAEDGLTLLCSRQEEDQTPNQRFDSDNEALKLAVELLESNDQWPDIDVGGARINHWNGHKISVARSDIDDLIDRGLLDSDGGWTDSGRAFVLLSLERYVEASYWMQRAQPNAAYQ